CQQGYYTPLTF
nr:immunoglobulin light chain junction region [Macaca mulatta]MOX49105.1 immunoglobulin light chain junction region [Macaca mulatta]MOX49153.1 immunoglobulin light chain junction region [Macaca mulatta]